MAESEFALRYIYWAAVRMFGWLVYGAKKTRRGWQGTGQGIGPFEPVPPHEKSAS